MFIVEDLYMLKNFLRIFPKEHQLYDRFVLFYHKGISNKLCEIITSELDRREIVQLLNWIRIYPSEQLLGMPFLQVNAFALLDDYPLLFLMRNLNAFRISSSMKRKAKYAIGRLKLS
uniref:Exocyst complex component 3 n=1 Tax=Ascaris suum TaxID=6253 RepID=F1LCT1_ASCSU